MSDLRETLIDMAITHGDTRSREDSTYFVEDVLTVVREALLTPEAVDAVTDELANYDLYDTDVRLALIGALGAAGLGGDGHE